MPFQIAIDIAAPPDRVWSIMRDVERWPGWTPSVTSVRLLDPGPLALGSRALIRQPKLPPALWRVTEIDDRARFFTWISTAPGIHVTARHSVAQSATGSKASLSIEHRGLFGGLLARLTRDITNRYLALEANGLKQHSERKVPAAT